VKAGKELDAEIAEKVMEWTVDGIWRMYTGEVVRHAAGNNMKTRFNPSTDISAAWEVVEKLMSEGWEFSLDTSGEYEWNVRFWMGDTFHDSGYVSAASLAISIAARKTVE